MAAQDATLATSARSAGSFRGYEVTSFQREKRAFDLILGFILRAVGLFPAPKTEFGGYCEQKGNIHKMTIWLSPLTEFRLERDYRLDGSRSKNEFIERAITHYQDLLEAEQNEMLPTAIQSAIDGRLGMFEDRLSRLFYKLSVELDMGMSAVLDCVRVDADYLRKLRADSVKNVKATNGLLTFEQKVREQSDDGDGDEQWQS